MRLHIILLTTLTAWLAVGCGLVRHSTVPQSGRPINIPSSGSSGPSVEEDSGSVESEQKPPPAMNLASERNIRSLLLQAYSEWEGTPYLLGGETKSGIDCSQLVNTIFDEYFNIDLPRTTRRQLNAGKNIRRSAVRTGDLVFFRTGRKTLHVGIAVNRGEFLHASTSNGVMISKLGNSYWRERYLTARRVL